MRLGMIERAAEAFGVAVTQAPGMRAAHRRLAHLYREHLDEPVLAERHRTLAGARAQPERSRNRRFDRRQDRL
jgi:hypothetical protein